MQSTYQIQSDTAQVQSTQRASVINPQQPSSGVCAHCNQPIFGQVISALDQTWHPEHFICTQCSAPFGAGTFYPKAGRPYCQECFYSVYMDRCKSCNQPVKNDCISALGYKWHTEHFNCAKCSKSLVGETFYEFQGQAYCSTHYFEMAGAVCGGCHKAINGQFITAMGKKYHPDHFVCSYCMNPIKGSYKAKEDKAYCQNCFRRLYAPGAY